MADLKISALTASTTPLAGTEVLPIVQSSTTKQVSVANLTAGRAVSALSYASTTGALFATTSGNVGVGPATASVKLHIQGVSTVISGSAKATTFIDDTTALAANVGGAITFRGKYTGAGDYSPGAYVQAQKTNATDSNDSFDLVFGTRENGNGTLEAFRLTDTKDVKVTTGNLVIGTSGKGIDFSATAGTGTSELLADYEEGTWTPAWVAGTGTLGSITYENRQGTYTKVGRMVTAQGGFYNSAFAAGTGSGDLKISGLPFTNGSAAIGAGSISDVRLWLVNNPCAMQVGVSASSTLLYYKTTANGAINNLQVSDATNGAATNLVYFTITYQV